MHCDWHIWCERVQGLWRATVEEVTAGDGNAAVIEAVHVTRLFVSERHAILAAEDWLAKYKAALESRWSPC
jgi:hypothetical protein